jgi:hypothetical protein
MVMGSGPVGEPTDLASMSGDSPGRKQPYN